MLFRAAQLRTPLMLWWVWLCCASGFAQAQVSGAELERFRQAHPVIRYAADPDFAPIDYVEADQHKGLSKDYLDLVAAASGVRFERVHFDSWAESLAAFKAGQVDLLTSLFVSPRRQAFALFTQPYLRPGASLLQRAGEQPVRDLADLGNRPLGIVRESVWFELLGEDASRLNLQPYSRLGEALKGLVAGQVEAVISDPVTGLEQARRHGMDGRIQVSADLDLEAPVAFGVQPRLPMLQRIIDAQFQHIGVEQEARLRARWFGDGSVAPVTVASPEIPASERARIEAQLAALGEDAEPAARQTLQEALALDAQAEQLLAQLAEAAAPAAAPAREADQPDDADLRRFLLWRASLPERASVEEVQRLLRGEQAALQAIETRRDDAALRLRDLRQRQVDAPLELERIQRGLLDSGEARVKLVEPTPAQWLEQARTRLALVRMALLQRELADLPVQIDRVEGVLESDRREVNRYRQRVQALQELQRERVVREAEARLAEVERVHRAAPSTDGESQGRGQRILELATRTVELARRYAEAVPDLLEQSRRAEAVARSLDLTRQRLALQAVGPALGRVLAAERRNIEPPREAARALQAIDDELAELRLEQIELGAEQAELLEQAGLARLPLEEDDASLLSSEWQRQELLGRQRQLIGEALELSGLLQGTLEATRRELQRRETDSRELLVQIDERLPWLPTRGALSLPGWHPIDALVDLVKPSRWGYTLGLVGRDLEQRGGWLAGAVLGVVALWWLRRRARARLLALGEDQAQLRNSIRPAFHGLLLATLAAAFWPAVCLLLGGYLQSLGEAGKFTDSLGGSLIAIAPQFLLISGLRWYSLAGGVPRLLDWDPRRAGGLHALATRLAWLILPVVWLAQLQLLRASELGVNSLGRPLLLLMTLGIAVLLWQVTRPGQALGWQGTASEGGMTALWQRRLHLLLPGALVLLALLQAAGYSEVSFMVLEAAGSSFYLLLLLLLFRRLVLRWLLLQERRLAEKRYQEQLQARLSESSAVDDSSDAPPRVEPEEVTLASISEQTRRLLRAFLWTAGGLGLLWIWSGLFPALQALDGSVLWQLAPAEGQLEGRAVTVLDGLLCLATLVLTTIAARNLPGLLEIGLLQKMPVDHATRYAITSLCRYVIVIGGLVYGISLLGVRWGHLQWMAAALTVGLGFGLQEIFANFVSGLILLFERPFRVGDTITIGQLSGTVTRIRTRATTILDWDNREIMVPNKTFITGDLVNWTLSDTTTRITLKVGAAYGSDPERVLALLKELAEAHPKVLAEPKPTSWLVAFGASSIDFELRVFVAEIRDRLPVSTELATQIHRRFRAEGIEIPFPQVDLHVRTPPSSDT